MLEFLSRRCAMELETAVKKYLEVVGAFGRPMRLADWGLAREPVEALLAAWEEDYQLHRHFQLIPAEKNAAAADEPYQIQGIFYTAIVFQASILDVLRDT
ncbi:MAG: hypothetical protein HY647_05815 [Acidobacteria bacterium]|nr:hypothetical protein [Acidobacteriota bacterium]